MACSRKSPGGSKLLPFTDDEGHYADWDLQCCRKLSVTFPKSVPRYNPISEVYTQFLGLHGSMISLSATARNLGVTMDNQLSFSSHVTKCDTLMSVSSVQHQKDSAISIHTGYSGACSVSGHFEIGLLQLSSGRSTSERRAYLKALITPRTAPRSLRSTSPARLVPPSLREKVFPYSNPAESGPTYSNSKWSLESFRQSSGFYWFGSPTGEV
ncbi:hypothetical protein QTP86_012404 [Hemibagrus guttatus]|nr:hypothetical protein QTP86_012404 [Hemibagrus guttatus]